MRAVQLWHQLLPRRNRPLRHLREKARKQQDFRIVLFRRNLPAINVDEVAYALEREVRQADGDKQPVRQGLQLRERLHQHHCAENRDHSADKQCAANAPTLRKPPHQACAAPNQQRFRREVRCPLPAAEQPERRTARQQRPLAHAHRQDVVHHGQRSKKPQKFKGYDAHNPSSCLSRTRSIFPFIVCGNCGRW